MKVLDIIELTRAEFDALPEYSCTVPTGVVDGKRWKRHQPYERDCKDLADCEHKGHVWLLGRYCWDKTRQCGNEAMFIFWLRIRIK